MESPSLVIWLFASVLIASLSVGAIVVACMRSSLMNAYIGIFGETIVRSWQKIVSAILVISSLSGGMSIYRLERYIFPENGNQDFVRELNSDAILLEVVHSLLNAAQSVIHVLLLLLITSVLVVLILKVKKLLPSSKEEGKD